MLKNINTEFPLGIDIILTDSFENIISIPRSIAIEIFNKN
jgi:alpha-D-ribose 1-methylphosphonate 5-triphosphate synthase subunit PhnH